MKFFTSQFIVKTTGFIVLLACSSLPTLAQGPSSIGYSLSSCFHTLTPNNTGKTLNVLNLGEFHFDYTSNAGAQPDFIRIRLYDNTGEVIGYEYEHMGLGDDIYNVSRHPDYGMLVAVHGLDVWKEKWLVNKNAFIFSDYVGSVEITMYHWTGDKGSRTLDPSLYQLKLNFVSPDEAFAPKSNNAPCLTFDNFDLGIDQPLNGFCGRFRSPQLTPRRPIPDGSGWNPNNNYDVVFGQHISIPQPQTDNGVSWCDDERTKQNASPTAPNPVPSGCINFDLKYELEPCANANANCPTVDIIKTISVCCTCDVRPIGPSN